MFFSNDEIIMDLSDLDQEHGIQMTQKIRNGVNDFSIPLKTELFILHKIMGTDGYYKEILNEDGDKKIEFKCLNNYVFPFVLRTFLGEEILESDKVFYYEGLLAKFVEIPEINIMSAI